MHLGYLISLLLKYPQFIERFWVFLFLHHSINLFHLLHLPPSPPRPHSPFPRSSSPSPLPPLVALSLSPLSPWPLSSSCQPPSSCPWLSPRTASWAQLPQPSSFSRILLVLFIWRVFLILTLGVVPVSRLKPCSTELASLSWEIAWELLRLHVFRKHEVQRLFGILNAEVLWVGTIYRGNPILMWLFVVQGIVVARFVDWNAAIWSLATL